MRLFALLHERWFIDSAAYPVRWEAFLEPRTVGITLLAVVIVAGLGLVYRKTGYAPVIPGPFGLGADERSLAILLGVIPALLSLHTAVPLVVNGINLHLFAPNLVLQEPGAAPMGSLFSAMAAVLEIGIGLALFYGTFTRASAALLVVLWLAGAWRFGALLLLEHALLLGVAGTLLITGRGPFSVDALLSARLGRPKLTLLRHAITPLRIGTAVSLITLAYTEKLANLPLALAFLDKYPVNFLPSIGIPAGNTTFMLLAGLVELMAGLLLLTNTYTRMGIVLLWLPFNITLAAFGWREFVGHLPIYGAMATLAIWGRGSESDEQALRRGLLQNPVLFGDPARAADLKAGM